MKRGCSVFMGRYPSERLEKIRILQSKGRPRGLAVLPKPGPPSGREIVHAESCVVPTPDPRLAFVTEWTGEVRAQHRVEL